MRKVADSRQSFMYLLLVIVVIASVLVYAFQVQRHAVTRAAGRTESATAALMTMLDQETGLRGYLYYGQETYLQPYVSGQAAYEKARHEVDAASTGDATSQQLASTEDSAARAWQVFAENTIAARRASAGAGNTVAPNQDQEALYGKQQMDRFRTLNSQLRVRLDQRRDVGMRNISISSTLAVVLLAALLVVGIVERVQRLARRTLARNSELEIAYRVRQREFSDLVQAVNSESEAHRLVQRHLQRMLPGATATVLSRNNSDNRLMAATELPAGSALAHALVSADPLDCLAIRLGRSYQDGPEHADLLSCQICSHLPGAASCRPMLVASEVIGSVLIEQALPLVEAELRAVADTVSQAGPVLANLKTIAIAENRASTDVLTGLPNRRAMNDTLKRMAAYADRTAKPLAAIAFDLDHFKTINDRYGHETGDAALSAVGECLHATLRDSDFAARVGGEEFLVLAPDTDVEGARLLAEKLREALQSTEIPSLLEHVTASFGVAVIPDHAASIETLLSQADTASYAAKERGRNRVELAAEDERISTPG